MIIFLISAVVTYVVVSWWLRPSKPKTGKCETCGASSDALRNGLCDDCDFAERAW